MIESEMVIVDDDGTEEPFDPASWSAPVVITRAIGHSRGT
jgi:hypothetical protein